jgi:hypothetical protein
VAASAGLFLSRLPQPHPGPLAITDHAQISCYLKIVTTKSKKDNSKAERERAVFLRFALVAGKSIDPATIKSGAPGESDIACATFSGERLAFELCELCDQGLMAQIRRASKVVGISSFSSLNCVDIRATFLKKAW